MDTHWFAVDELGHVAVFQSKELGPVPESASAVWPTDGRLEQVFLPQLADVDPDALSYEAADIFAGHGRGVFARMFGQRELLTEPPRYNQSLHSVLLQLRSLDGARERLSAVGLHLLPSREGGYAWGNLDTPQLRELWREGWILRAALAHGIEPTRMGLFCYEHRDEDGYESEDLYLRWDTPRVAVRVHALPTSLRMRVAATRFVGVDFRVSESVCVSRLTFC